MRKMVMARMVMALILAGSILTFAQDKPSAMEPTVAELKLQLAQKDVQIAQLKLQLLQAAYQQAQGELLIAQKAVQDATPKPSESLKK